MGYQSSLFSLVDRLAGEGGEEGEASITSGLHIGQSEMLRSLKHYLRAQKATASHRRLPGGERYGKRKR